MDAVQAKAVLEKHGFRRGIDGTANMDEPKRGEIKAACQVLKEADQADQRAKRVR